MFSAAEGKPQAIAAVLNTSFLAVKHESVWDVPKKQGCPTHVRRGPQQHHPCLPRAECNLYRSRSNQYRGLLSVRQNYQFHKHFAKSFCLICLINAIVLEVLTAMVPILQGWHSQLLHKHIGQQRSCAEHLKNKGLITVLTW